MDTIYRDITELPAAALDFLRDAWWWEEDSTAYETYDDPTEIPDDALCDHYAGIYFVPEDFVCMAGDDWGKVV